VSAYADTSFLVSLYTPDANSVRAATAIGRTPAVIVLTPLHFLELTNALELRVFRRELTAAEVRAALAAFRSDVESGVFRGVALPEDVFERARRLSHKHSARLGTRALDVLHVASALSLKADLLLTFDGRQRALARALRLKAADA
jgi:predicted nucleic acid-binding protein